MITDDDIHGQAQLTDESVDTAIQSSGGFFPRSKQFTITGGIFTSKVTNNFHKGAGIPSAIPLGDIDLQREIRLDVGRNVVDRRCERTTVRRVYAAKIEGRSSDMTVAMYEGHGAEEEWRHGLSQITNFLASASQHCSTAWHSQFFRHIRCGIPWRSVSGLNTIVFLCGYLT
ncbi:hypothetical protein C8R45DRAFT_960506 [Mycena sanguinolenta]|nr:hypothetical protein C8R45DRAFT_960506 [Mycena sanguinolenta]